ncbi:MAG: undecaprenyldiphospho-muramoylpentapeptide beta-N-acetylglucosaminyltransferase [Candidatus Omnitrophica bacterium]|nr:undecaprenyldiphospho-muramoylpentapeptide beta-N-acetylglucosaminyltransferase [Candidatus Omnitrophota bacterium]
MKILITTGGSGGHVFPALCVAAELKDQGHEIAFAGAFGNTRNKIEEAGFPLSPLPTKGLVSKSIKSVLVFFYFMIKSILAAFKVVCQFKPDVVLGFGGYGSFPIVFSAFILRCPTIIHEQNVVLGRANAVLARLVKKVALSFEETKQYLKARKVIVTGYPCRIVRQDFSLSGLYEEFGLREGYKTIVVLGGSQGSHVVNAVFLETVVLLKDFARVQVVHVAGVKEHEAVARKYESFDIPHKVFGFFDEMRKIYAVADVVVCRAGAGTVVELAALGLPAVLVPYPYAQGHQKANAGLLAKTSAVRVIEEKDLSADSLSAAVFGLIEAAVDKEAVRETRKSIYQSRAVSALAQAVIEVAKK